MAMLIQYVLGIILFQSVYSDSPPSPPDHDMSPYALKTNSTYLVVAPKLLRPGRPYEISISIQDIMEPVQVDAIIKHRLNYILQSSVQVKQSRPGRIKFMIPADLPNSDYSLVVFGKMASLDFLFLNETKLEYEPKAISTFIQTDKPIYRAGQKVQFRVFIVDPDLTPYIGPVNISIYDGKNNKIKQWLNEKNENGVISQNLQLSDQPVLGNWKIQVDFIGKVESSSFSVEEYVLPKFEVKVILPKYILWKDSVLYVEVNATYTFGKPVSGNLELQVKRSYYGETTLLRTGQIANGSSIIAIPLRSLYPVKDVVTENSEVPLKITAVITEPVTNVSRNASADITVYKSDVKLKLVKPYSTYKPNLPYRFNIIVTKPDGSPVKPIQFKLNVTCIVKNQKDDTKQTHTQLLDIPESGIVLVIIPIDLNTNNKDLEISYGEVKISETIFLAATSPSNNYLQIIGSDQPVKIDGTAIFEVMCTEPRQDINYIVLSKERVISTGLLKMKGKTNLKFSLKISRIMAPVSRLLVYYIRSDGEIIADGLAYDVDDFFQNKVTLNFELSNGMNVSDNVSPGDEIFLSGSAAPNSFVGIVAVDQSVLLLKEQSDITESVILKELKNFDDVEKPYELDSNSIKGSYGFYATNAMAVFSNAGVIIMTNAGSQNPKPPVLRHPSSHSHKKVVAQKEEFEDLEEDNDLDMHGYSNEANLEQSYVKEISAKEEVPQVRSKFPESWIWMNIMAGNNGEFSQNETVPDTITSWVASAISLDKTYGLGVTSTKAKLNVFRPFFVSINLPYSVIRGEVLQMQVLVFNYLEDGAEVTLELEKSDQFELAVAEDKETSPFARTIKVDYGKPGSVTYPIVPLVAGLIDIKVIAKMKNAGDAELKKLLVKPEGVTQFFSSSFLIDLRKDKQISETVSISLPSKDIVSGSERAEVSASGDLFGNTIINLDNLVRVPGGCGEQNLVSFVPNVLILNYLTTTKQLNSDLRNRVVGYLETGYQRQLTYKNSDGSFSFFGREEKPGSTWLTAFVIKSFQQAKSYIGIDSDVMKASITWLLKQKQMDGSFNETGDLFNRNIQGGQFGTVTLAAYIVTALQNINLEIPEINSVLSETQNYLESQVDVLTEPYSLALVSYALTLLDSSKSDQVFEKLQSISQKDGDMEYWSQTVTTDVDPMLKWNPFRTRLIDIETTSYALLTYILKKKTAQSVPIAKWLNSKRNSFGGFQSTQDTVIGLEALTAYAEEVYSPDTNIKIQFKARKQLSENFNVNNDNALLHQTSVLPHVFKKLQIIATGVGTALAQVSWQYNLVEPKETDAFILDINTLSNQETLTVKVCARHQEKSITGMVVMEVSLPSGYAADTSSVKELLTMNSVQRIDNEDGDTRIVVYFSEMSDEETCLKFKANKNFIVEKLKDTPVTIYEYYSPEKRTTRFYKLIEENMEEKEI